MVEWQLGGIRFRLSLWFPAVIIAVLSTDRTGLSGLCLWVSLIHEMGHFIAMAAVNDHPLCMTFGGFGMRIERAPGFQLGYGASCIVSLAGPAANALVCAFMTAIGCREAAWLHGGMALFNALPIASLDGGEALTALISAYGNPLTAARAVRLLSYILLLPLAAGGLWLLCGEGNPSLLAVSLYLAVRVFST